MNESVHGIEYSKPKVVYLQETGIGAAEFAARTCYDSFDKSDSDVIKYLNDAVNERDIGTSEDLQAYILGLRYALNELEHSDLLDDLAWTHFHHSILEHANLTYLIKGTSRGVLQEHARHRIQAISVRSTRYTMSDVIYAYMCSHVCGTTIAGYDWFVQKILSFDMFVTSNNKYNEIEARSIWDKLEYQWQRQDNFQELALAKQNLDIYMQSDDVNGYLWQPDKLFEAFQQNKKKRNVGDAFKHIVTDNWKVDMVVTMNLRALKNYLTLRDSGAAYFQIRWLAQAIKTVTPSRYLDLIIKQ